MDSANVYIRANGQMLHDVRGQNVCLLGKCTKSNSDGRSFEIKTCDNKTVLCKLKVPIRDSLSDIVEVYGEVDDNGNINCLNYATFEQSQIDNFGIFQQIFYQLIWFQSLFIFVLFLFRYGIVQ